MLSLEENERLTRVGPGSDAGSVLRQHWQPVALSEELDPARPIKPVNLMGEHLVLFRTPQGDCRLVARACPHRGADLAFGRLEDGGLRCPFHGWLFDGHGACLEQPAEPVGKDFHKRVRQQAYPCRERNGTVFAFLGSGEPPPLPSLDCLIAPDSHVFSFKGLWHCNWLQALEVGVDPAHASFLHRFLEDDSVDAAYGRQFRDEAADSKMPLTQVLREYDRPEIRIEDTDYGFRLVTLRRIDDQQTHVRVTNLLFPNAIVIPMSKEMVITQWHVPVDDESCYWHSMFVSFGAPVDKARMRSQRIGLNPPPDYKPKYGKHNDWGFDAKEQQFHTYTGMGDDINVHDQWAVESPGPIADRTHQYLGQSDVGVLRYRRLLRRAMEADSKDAGSLPISNPVAIDEIGPAEDWQSCWRERDQRRRAQSSWAKDVWPS